MKEKEEDKSVRFNSIIGNILLQKIVYLDVSKDSILKVTFLHSI